MDLPEEILHRLRGVPGENVADEGIQIACEQIAQFREMRGVAGVHLMAIEWEHRVPEIAEKAGLLPRPTIHRADGNSALPGNTMKKVGR